MIATPICGSCSFACSSQVVVSGDWHKLSLGACHCALVTTLHPVHHCLRLFQQWKVWCNLHMLSTGAVLSFSRRMSKACWHSMFHFAVNGLESFLMSLIHGGIHSPTGVGVLLSLQSCLWPCDNNLQNQGKFWVLLPWLGLAILLQLPPSAKDLSPESLHFDHN